MEEIIILIAFLMSIAPYVALYFIFKEDKTK